MEEIIRGLLGKKIDVSCGSNAALRGEAVEIRNGVLVMKDEDERRAFVAIDKIATVAECADQAVRPGFIA